MPQHLRQILKVIVQISTPILLSLLIFRSWSSWNSWTTSMPSLPSAADMASALLAEADLDLVSTTPLQSLWAGYGQISRIAASPRGRPEKPSGSGSQFGALTAAAHSYILKLITPPAVQVDDEGHVRKLLSYRVEQYFYTHLALQLPAFVPVAQCIASTAQHHANGTSTAAMLLTDLKQLYPVAGEARGTLTPTQANATLDWLAGFHGFWWARAGDFDSDAFVRPPLEQAQRGADAPASVWLNGGYTYLATRRGEYAALAADYASEWNDALTEWVDGESVSVGELVGTFLAPRAGGGWGPIAAYQTLIHGDVKAENLFASRAGDQVVLYDFQYVGLGLGVCDLAKLFTCAVPLDLLVESRDIPRELPMQKGERVLLERYWTRLREVAGLEYEWAIFVRHWEVALVDWLRFQASWGFWGNTEWLEARARHILKDEAWRNAVLGNAKFSGTAR